VQYFAEGTTSTSRPDIVALSAFHAAASGYPELPGILRQSGEFEGLFSDAASPTTAQSRNARKLVRNFI
jgi:hypothetical protein